tara:strand:- start:190 stop:444 length:255 start_codon:yes stop_codon:yes gene_type:complete
MEKREEMLVITAEECGELIQACSKVIRSKGKTEYLKNLQDEVGDVVCMIKLLIESDLVTEEQIDNRVREKKQKLKKWSSLFNED